VPPVSNLPALGVYETIKKIGVDTTFPHHHCLLAVPCAQVSLFRQASTNFWANIARVATGNLFSTGAVYRARTSDMPLSQEDLES
jgi:hypothetical protein